MFRKRSNTGRLLLRWIGIVALLLLTGCLEAKAPVAPEENTPLLPGDQPVEHPVHSSELMAAMLQFEELALNELTESVEPGAAEEPRLSDVESLASTIADAAGELPGILATVDLPAPREARFRELAAQLATDAASLRDRAAAGSVENARDEREALLKTCNACHAEFRVLTPYD